MYSDRDKLVATRFYVSSSNDDELIARYILPSTLGLATSCARLAGDLRVAAAPGGLAHPDPGYEQQAVSITDISVDQPKIQSS
jgi:hypothetical protein